MPFNDAPVQTGSSEPKNKVYIKGIQPWLNKSNPFFEVNMSDWTKSEHKSMVGMKFVSAEPHVYTTEEWGDKQQIHISLEDSDWTLYDLYANWNSITRQMYNAIAWADKIDTMTIVFNYNWAWEYMWVSVFIDWASKPIQWAFSWDDYHNKVAKAMISWKEVKDYTELDKAITDKIITINKVEERDLVKELEEQEAKVEKSKPKAKTEDSDLPF